MPEFAPTFPVIIQSGQPFGFVDIPTHDVKQMALRGMTASATNAVSNVVEDGVVTVLQSNGFLIKPVEGGKPDVVVSPGATLRVLCSRTTPSVDIIRILVSVHLIELP